MGLMALVILVLFLIGACVLISEEEP